MCIALLLVLFFSSVKASVVAVNMSIGDISFTPDRVVVESYIEMSMPNTFKAEYAKLLESQKMRYEELSVVLNRGGRDDLIQKLFESVLVEEQNRCANFQVITPNPPPSDISEQLKLTWTLTNDVRIRQCLQPLHWNSQLAAASQKWAEQMDILGRPVHCAAAIDDPYTSCRAEIQARVPGYQGEIGENTAAGEVSADVVVQGWWNSFFHRRNLLKRSYTDYGAGVVFSPTKNFVAMWVQKFGQPSSGSQAVDGSNAKEYVPKSEVQQPNTILMIVCISVGAVFVVAVVVVIVAVTKKKQVEQV